MLKLLRFFPKVLLSRVVGRISLMRYPKSLVCYLIRLFCRKYDVNTDEMVCSTDSYNSLSDFFVREIHPRPQAGGLVSPADSQLRSFGDISGDQIVEIKGNEFNLCRLLGAKDRAKQFTAGSYFNLYLSPQDYHRVHFPFDGRILESIYIPGTLWPVNDLFVSSIPTVYVENERLVTYLQTSNGLIAIVMVGALNVGKILTSYDTNVSYQSLFNFYIARKSIIKHYQQPIEVQKGDELGRFLLGSTVVLLTEKCLKIDTQLYSGMKLKYGQSLAQ